MKKQLITTLLLTISAGAGNAMTSENIDSLSYAYGYQYTIATMAGKNDFMQSEQDFSDYIRGLEEGNRNLTQMNDSSYLLSYSLGAMQAIFMTDDLQTTIGIINTKSVFAADVRRASVELDTASGMVNVEWAFDADDAIKWSKFTEASIGRHVAVEIDGRFMFAPRVNQQITGGHCAISGLTSEEINQLFKNAEKDVNQHPADTIEVIEIN